LVGRDRRGEEERGRERVGERERGTKRDPERRRRRRRRKVGDMQVVDVREWGAVGYQENLTRVQQDHRKREPDCTALAHTALFVRVSSSMSALALAMSAAAWARSDRPALSDASS
jgi:hypothetical protein